MVDLAGEATGIRSDALVNSPLEPRLFVYRRDGSALELLRNDDAQRWCDSVSLLRSTAQRQQHQRQRGEGKASDVGAEGAVVDAREDDCFSDPHSQGARQVRITSDSAVMHSQAALLYGEILSTTVYIYPVVV